MLILVKTTELPDFKSLGGVRSGSLEIICLGRASQSFTCPACIQNYTLRYNVTDVTIYAYHYVIIRYA